MNKPSIPPHKEDTILPFLVYTYPQFIVGSFSNSIPNSLKSLWASSYLWEIFNKALEGIQPTFKQVPPKVPLPSTQAVFKPN